MEWTFWSRNSDEASFQEFRLEWIGCLKVSHADGERVSGVGRRGFGKAEDGANHEGDLAFVGIAISDNGHFHLFRRVFKNFQSVIGGSDERCGAGGPHGNGRLVGLDINDAFHGNFIRLELLDDIHQVSPNCGKRRGLSGGFRDGNDVEGKDRRLPWIPLEDGVAGIADCGIDRKDAHGWNWMGGVTITGDLTQTEAALNELAPEARPLMG